MLFHATDKRKLIHADLRGAIMPLIPGGKHYFLLMLDDFSRYIWLVFLSTKDEAEVAIRRVKAELRCRVIAHCECYI